MTDVLFHVGWLYAATGLPPLQDAAVMVSDGRITRVGPIGEFADVLKASKVPVAAHADCTLLPGLIDAHCHITLAGDSRTYEEMAVDRDELMALVAVRNLQLHLSAGVTTLRDNGGRNLVPFAVREAIERQYISGPRLLLSGRPVTRSGGHMHWCNGAADGAEAIEAMVRALVAEGVDHIKLMASGGGTAGTHPYLPSYSVEELQVAVRIAHELERLTTAHCRALSSMWNALEAGSDCIEHAEYLVRREIVDYGGGVTSPEASEYDPRIAERMLADGTYLSATLQSRYDSLLDLRSKRSELDAHGKGRLSLLEAAHENQLEIIGKLLADGMKDTLVVSTDAGPFETPFGGLQRAMRVAVEGGLTPTQAIDACTIIAAKACGIDDRLGSIEAGKEADLLLVRGTPFRDIHQMDNVARVYLGGREVAPIKFVGVEAM